MKKILSITVLLIVGCLSLFVFSGCDNRKKEYLTFGSKDYSFSLSFNVNDREGYDLDLNNALSGITINLCTKDKDGKEQVLIKDINGLDAYKDGASFSNLSLKSTGTRTCTVTYKGASGSFKYVVH